MSPCRLGLGLVVVTAALALFSAAAGARGPVAHDAAGCSLRGAYRTLGPSYVTSLRVEHTGCASGKRLVRSYDRCRRRSGGARGRCGSRVLRYRCTEHRTGIAIQFDANVTCRSGTRRVWFTYVQNT